MKQATCDLCFDNPANGLAVVRRPSDPSELVSVVATCESCEFHDPLANKDILIEKLASVDGGAYIAMNLVEWLYTDEAIEKLGEIGILFVTF